MTTQSLLYNKNIQVSRGSLEKPAGSVRHPHNQRHGQTRLPPDPQSSLGGGFGNLPVGVKGDSPGALSQSQKSEANSYLDKKARSDNSKVKSSPEAYCGKYGKVGDGDGGDRYFKKIFCYKDWCSKCRKIGHGRRLARIMPKISVMATAGFWVVTIPREMRGFFESKKNLSVARTYLRRKFERIYPGIQAIIALHTHGEVTEEDLEAEKIQIYKPHWNILVNGQKKIPNSVIEEVKRDWKRYLERATGINLGNKKVVVWYSFRDTKEKISHTARYITRPTFLVYDERLAQKLKGFVRMSVWGAKRFRILSEEELMNEAVQREKYTKLPPAVVLLQNNTSPKDGGRIYWRSRLYPGWLSEFGTDLGFGYTDISNLSDDDITALEIRYKMEADKNGEAVFRKDIAWRATDEEKDRLAREKGRDWWSDDDE